MNGQYLPNNFSFHQDNYTTFTEVLLDRPNTLYDALSLYEIFYFFACGFCSTRLYYITRNKTLSLSGAYLAILAATPVAIFKQGCVLVG